MKFYKRLNKYKASNFELDMNTLKAYSYPSKNFRGTGPYILGMMIGDIYIVNNYNFSQSTIQHYYKLIKLLNILGIEYQTIEAPNGLQGLSSAIDYYKMKIDNLMTLINKPRTRASTNIERHNQILKYKSKINFINILMGA